MNWKEEYKPLLWISGFFVLAYFIPIENTRFAESVMAALDLTRWYAREHVLLCLVPAFFIAGVIAVFVSQAAVIKYFGAGAKKWVSYAVASVSGTVLAVCSCTILPLFSSIHKRGAGLGPAIAFLYSGPAINILAIILTARILGWKLGLARVVGAMVFSVVIGLLMHLIYRKEEAEKAAAQFSMPKQEEERPLWQTAAHFFILVFILIFATLAKPDSMKGIWAFLFEWKWVLTSGFGLLLSWSLIAIIKIKPQHVILAAVAIFLSYLLAPQMALIPFSVGVIALSILLSTANDEAQMWMSASWGFAKQILPLLGAGVLIAGFLLGMPGGKQGIIPGNWISDLVGGNSLFANFFASVSGAFMYFATLTEVPILQGLVHSGMGQGPALALLLAGPALSLPNMLVIRGVLGTQKTVVYVSLVVVMATISGLLYGSLF